MNLQITAEDPETCTKPWAATFRLHRLPDPEPTQFICDNEEDTPPLACQQE